MANPTPRPFYSRGRDAVPIVQEAGWTPAPVWTSAENLDPTGIRSPDRPDRSKSLKWRRIIFLTLGSRCFIHIRFAILKLVFKIQVFWETTPCRYMPRIKRNLGLRRRDIQADALVPSWGSRIFRNVDIHRFTRLETSFTSVFTEKNYWIISWASFTWNTRPQVSRCCVVMLPS